MVEIRLQKAAWRYDPSAPLGPAGGFGAVFEGADGSANPVAVKKLHITAATAAHRELAIAADLAGRPLQHVMPVLDAGQDANSDGYFVVMPVAEYSLQQYLDRNGPVAETYAASILINILSGLEEVPHIVHRDLKPANVLWHDGMWKIADFGIARFVEESTSTETLKRALSPYYAAPEQWRHERATAATDIYALGCIAHTVVSGTPPFEGTIEQVREAHLQRPPPDLEGVTAAFQTAVRMMLRKAPEARPTRERIAGIMRQVGSPPAPAAPSGPLARLAAAADAHEREEAERAAEQARHRSAAESRRAILVDATAILREVALELAGRVANLIPNATVQRNERVLSIRVGQAALEMSISCHYYGEDAFPRSRWDVLAGSSVVVTQSKPEWQRAASLWYTRRESKEGEYRWLEVGYASNPLMGRQYRFKPVALDSETADRAHWNAISDVQVAYGPTPIDGEDSHSFCERWLYILAVAAEGGLERLHGGLIRPADERG